MHPNSSLEFVRKQVRNVAAMCTELYPEWIPIEMEYFSFNPRLNLRRVLDVNRKEVTQNVVVRCEHLSVPSIKVFETTKSRGKLRLDLFSDISGLSVRGNNDHTKELFGNFHEDIFARDTTEIRIYCNHPLLQRIANMNILDL